MDASYSAEMTYQVFWLIVNIALTTSVALASNIFTETHQKNIVVLNSFLASNVAIGLLSFLVFVLQRQNIVIEVCHKYNIADQIGREWKSLYKMLDKLWSWRYHKENVEEKKTGMKKRGVYRDGIREIN